MRMLEYLKMRLIDKPVCRVCGCHSFSVCRNRPPFKAGEDPFGVEYVCRSCGAHKKATDFLGRPKAKVESKVYHDSQKRERVR